MGKFTLNRRGVRELLNSPEVARMLREESRKRASAAGEGFTSDVSKGGDRLNAHVRASTPEARRRQARDHVLERVIGSGP